MKYNCCMKMGAIKIIKRIIELKINLYQVLFLFFKWLKKEYTKQFYRCDREEYTSFDSRLQLMLQSGVPSKAYFGRNRIQWLAHTHTHTHTYRHHCKNINYYTMWIFNVDKWRQCVRIRTENSQKGATISFPYSL